MALSEAIQERSVSRWDLIELAELASEFSQCCLLAQLTNLPRERRVDQ
jgi:hypothetical protein